jgi:hypothetical protein
VRIAKFFGSSSRLMSTILKFGGSMDFLSRSVQMRTARLCGHAES